MLKSITQKPKTEFAKILRRNQTSGEKVLWNKLRMKRFHGLKFRRQVPLGPFIVDFLCVEKKLVIEIDGASHAEPGAVDRDARREQFLVGKGFTVLRFGNAQTIESVEWVLNEIRDHLGLSLD